MPRTGQCTGVGVDDALISYLRARYEEIGERAVAQWAGVARTTYVRVLALHRAYPDTALRLHRMAAAHLHGQGLLEAGASVEDLLTACTAYAAERAA